MAKKPIEAKDIEKGDISRVTMPSLALRLIMLGYLFVTVPGAIGYTFDSDSYQQPLYSEVIFALTPWFIWAGAWTVTTAAILYYTFTKKYVAFILTNCMLVFLGLSYTLMLAYAKFIEGLPLSHLAIGIWTTLAVIPNIILFINFKLEKAD